MKNHISLIFCLLMMMSCSGKSDRPEITWSLMHPTALDTVYMQKVLKEAEGRIVDNFEICGACNAFTKGSLDGLLMFEEYPLAMEAQDSAAVRHNQKSLQRIVEMCHEAGKKVVYWHREVLCNPGMVASVPALLNAEGEFDLLGEEYEKFLRYKIRKTFELVPDLDGIVLTLTEASFSAIHNSRPDLYPPEKVVERIGGIFAEELEARGKRFILRSFGSIADDYNSIQKGAELLARKHSFEIETKITPYDFSPFLPDNPYLTKIDGCTLGAECDALGEYLGAGRLPAENVDDIARYVNYGHKCKVDRFTIRLDRHKKNVFDIHPINLYAYEQAILHPGISGEKIRRDYYGSLYPSDIAAELTEMSREGDECTKKTVFVDGNVIFHQFPTDPKMTFIKAGGVLAAFTSEGDLHQKQQQWGMLYNNPVPGRDVILREKEEALALADKNLSRLETLKPQLTEFDYERLLSVWTNARSEAEAIGEYTKVICAYFDSMEAGDAEGTALKTALAHLYDVIGNRRTLRPVRELADLFGEEYPMEFKARKVLKEDTSMIDFVLPGGSIDQVRLEQYMHGAYPEIRDNRLGLKIGNGVFPNAYLEIEMKGSDVPVELRIAGDGECTVEINGNATVVSLNSGAVIPLEPAEGYKVFIRKAPLEDFPVVTSVSLHRK